MTELRRTLGFTDLAADRDRNGDRLRDLPRARASCCAQTGGRPASRSMVWVVAGVLSLLGALTYAELGAMQPEAGGLYTYIRDAFGPLPAFLYGWTSFLVIASGSIADARRRVRGLPLAARPVRRHRARVDLAAR